MNASLGVPEHFPTGPALLYVTQPDQSGLITEDPSFLIQVDRFTIKEGGPLSADGAYRERAILRALLVHALHLVDAEDADGRDR